MSAASLPAGHSGTPERPDADRRQSFSKYLSRAKTVLRRDKTKRQSIGGDGANESRPAESTISETPPTTNPAAAPAVTPASAPMPSQPILETTAQEAVDAKPSVGQSRSMNAIRQERAKAMFAKYGFTLEEHEWTQKSEPTDRVQKSIRMRIHRACHRCQTSYGNDKICSQCGHKRCKKCPRYPVKKPAKDGQDGAKVVSIKVAAIDLSQPRSKYDLVIPARPHAQDRVRRKTKQTVRRNCHRCEAVYPRGQKTCVQCAHVRCTRCPRDPPNLKKYPNGYPGDVPFEPEPEPKLGRIYQIRRVGKPSRQRLRWFCHCCDKMFQDRHQPCTNCQHERCEQCLREPPKRVKPTPDPDVVKSVEKKLAEMNLDRDKDDQKTEGRPSGKEGEGVGGKLTSMMGNLGLTSSAS